MGLSRSRLIKELHAIPSAARLKYLMVSVRVDDSERAIKKLSKIFIKDPPPKFGIPFHPHDLNEVPSFNVDAAGKVEKSCCRVWRYQAFIAEAITVFSEGNVLRLKGESTYIIRALLELNIPTEGIITSLLGDQDL